MIGKSTAVDLFWLHTSDNSPSWTLGLVVDVKPKVQQLREAVRDHLQRGNENFLLFWDRRLPLPQEKLIRMYGTPDYLLQRFP